MTILDSIHTNILADGEVSGRTPDAEGDFYLVTDAQADHNYWHERIVDSILASSSTPTAEFLILHGGIVSDSGSGQVDISECLAIGKNSSGDRRLIRIPALTNVSIPTGWNDGRNIWVIAQHDYKLGSATRTHRAGTSYHYQIQDTYFGDSNGYVSTSSDDLFTDSDPSATDTILAKFTITGTTFASAGLDERSPILKPLNDDKIIGSTLKFEASYIAITPSSPWFCMSLPDQTLSATNYPQSFIDILRAKKVVYDEFNTNVSSFSGSWSGSDFTLDDTTTNNAMLAELAEEWLFAGSPTTGWRILVSGGSEYNITNIVTSTRKITVSGSPSGTSIEIYLNRMLGSTTTAKHFSWAGLGLYMTGQNKITGLRRRDKFQGHRMAPLSPATGFDSTQTGGGRYLGTTTNELSSKATTGDPVTDTVHGTPRTGPKTEMESGTLLVYMYTGGYAA